MSVPIPPRAAGFYDPRTYDWEIGSSHSRALRRRFYVQNAGYPGAHVLELGCGTGDISIALAATGAHVVGIDSSSNMIEVARDKVRCSGTPVLLAQARIEAFAFRTRFSAVIIPYHALFHVLVDDHEIPQV